MVIREIIKVWRDENIIGDNIEFLSRPLSKVNFPHTDKTRKINNDLEDTAKAVLCTGIGDNQIDYSERVFYWISKHIYKSQRDYSGK